MAVYNVEESEGNKKANRFAFRLDGKVYSVAKIQYLKGETAEYLEKAVDENYSESRVTRGMLAIECPEVKNKLKNLRDDQVLKLSQQWAQSSQPVEEEPEPETESEDDDETAQ